MKTRLLLILLGFLYFFLGLSLAMPLQKEKSRQGAETKKENAEQPVKMSEAVAEQNLIYKVDPIYPSVAKKHHIEGVVALEILISVNGDVIRTRVLSGHPLLKKAAMDAVKKYRYRPFKIDGYPVEVITTVSVPFSLSAPKAPRESIKT